MQQFFFVFHKVMCVCHMSVLKCVKSSQGTAGGTSGQPVFSFRRGGFIARPIDDLPSRQARNIHLHLAHGQVEVFSSGLLKEPDCETGLYNILFVTIFCLRPCEMFPILKGETKFCFFGVWAPDSYLHGSKFRRLIARFTLIHMA